MISAKQGQVQIAAYTLLRVYIAEKIQTTSLQIEMKSTTEDDVKEEIARFLVKEIQTDVDFDDYYDQLRYLLSWLLVLEHFEDATYKLRAAYNRHLQSLSTQFSKFISLLMDNLDVGKQGTPLDLSMWDVAVFDIKGFDEYAEHSIELLSAYCYWKSLVAVPSIVRQWWNECKNRQLTLALESYTEKFFSPGIIAKELNAVSLADRSTLKDLVVKSSRVANEVSAAYVIEDNQLEIVIKIPSNYPLRQVTVEGGSGNELVVDTKRFRGWLLSVSSVMVSQNGSVLDALSLYQKNLSLHFEGVEDCAICYSVIGSLDRSLPTKRCKTCKHLFHGACLFKWFKSSNQSTCPLCRSLF